MTTRRRAMRYLVRNPEGQELMVPSLGALHDLYVHGFLGDEDLVRAETAGAWVRAGVHPALRGVRERRRDPRKVAVLLVAASVVAIGVALLAGALR